MAKRKRKEPPGPAELAAKIEKAWSRVPIPAAYTWIEDGEFREAQRKFGSGRHWSDLSCQELKPGYGDLGLVSADSTKAYYLAAFMVQVLNDSPASGVLVHEWLDEVGCTLLNMQRRGTLKDSMSPLQLECVREFVEMFKDHDNDYFGSLNLP